MKIAGIIAEYNPFHNGHLYQLKYTREILCADYIIVVMSGDYVQRGTPALLPKHTRAEMALRCGADLVLELPPAFSSASAEFFAKGGVQLLNSLHVVDILCFGSECGSVVPLTELAVLLTNEPEEYLQYLKFFLSKGISFPAARAQAVLKYSQNTHLEKILSSPNNILGIEYCKALLRLNSPIRPCTLKRQGAAYHDTSLNPKENPSASAIRTHLLSCPESFTQMKNSMPEEAFSIFADAIYSRSFITENDWNLLLHYRLLEENSVSMERFLDMSPDLAKRIEKQKNNFQDFSSFVALLKTKEITQTRIQRALLHLLLNIKDIPETIPYARVLGFKKDSTPLLKEIKKRSSIPLITKLADASAILDDKGIKLLNETCFSSNVYNSILCQKTGSPFLHELKKQLVII